MMDDRCKERVKTQATFSSPSTSPLVSPTNTLMWPPTPGDSFIVPWTLEIECLVGVVIFVSTEGCHGKQDVQQLAVVYLLVINNEAVIHSKDKRRQGT